MPKITPSRSWLGKCALFGALPSRARQQAEMALRGTRSDENDLGTGFQLIFDGAVAMGILRGKLNRRGVH
jgi:hypothetical protein